VSVAGFASSGLPGPKGNLETFVWLADAGRSAVADLERAVAEVEPIDPVAEVGPVDPVAEVGPVDPVAEGRP
jgi:23S rRNA (cytidine1920-2'-O)/16S rRNA (cytidine1409-2'-O)-methyltransferase